jgi:hypothetical protein
MRVFISHSRSDKKTARNIAQSLVDQGTEVWFDEWELEPGSNFAQAIGNGLESCDAMVVLVSPESLQSWQREEIQYAITTPRFEGRVIPVFVKNTPNVPWILETLNVVRPGRTDDETAQRIVQALQLQIAEAYLRQQER